jgi:chaperone required for assembly of F1-ATPase
VQRYDALLTTTTSLGFVAQHPQSLAALAQAVSRHDAHGLAVLGIIVPIFGSLVLGLAVTDGALDAAEACRLSTLDELFQEERWGEDAEAAASRAAALKDVTTAGQYLELARRNE